ncbi:CUB domain-containing protein [Ditylenchus destructor]|nr:CUB domain-containing protein [Ditylenchus destructor]
MSNISISEIDDDANGSRQNNSSANVKHLITDIDTKCPEGWEHLDNKCYRLYPIEHSWAQALAFCTRFGASLARIESQRENAFLSKLLAKPQRSAGASSKSEYWIGLLSQQSGQEDALFMWSNGAPVSRYVGFWARGQPDYRTGSCTKAGLGKHNGVEWELEMCNLLLPFVCEVPACVKGLFFCQNGGCVPERDHCNGVDNCGDWSDELNCPVSHNDLACLKHERGESGRIESPNFPSSYRANANCRWVIEGPINSRIMMTFDSFETEENQDLVIVSDGGPAENTSIVLDTLSGTPKSDRLSFVSRSNIIVVRFRSDALIQARGFQATWKAVSFSCGGTLKAQSYMQTIISPEYPRPYPNSLECVWQVEATSGNLISLHIEDFDLEEGRDFLVIYDGARPSAPVLAKLTGNSQTSPLIISSQNHLYIYFFTNHVNVRKGFSIGYKKGCDNTVRNFHGMVLSPGHGRVPYPTSQICKYTIELPYDASTKNAEDKSITVAINGFDVAADDQLQLYDGGENGHALHEFGGFNAMHKPPKVIYAKQSKLDIVFSSNSMRTGLGWNVTFSTNCPSLVVPKLVSISTQNTAFGTKVTVSCDRGFEFATGRGRFFDVQCELGGNWTESLLPDCQPIYCSPVPQIASGFAISATNVSFGGMAKYGCYEGFSFASGKKSEEIFCTDEGRWTGTPQCRAEMCAALATFQNGVRVLEFGDGIGYGSVYAFECSAGYRREGAPTILCQADGHWSSPQPYCKKLTCNQLPKVPNGRIVLPLEQEQSLYFGDSARVECNVGFRSVGAESIKCLANQTVSGTPGCKDVDECAEQLSSCTPKSTSCVNLEGGYSCECQTGFQPQLSCTNAASLTLSSVKASSGSPVSVTASRGWCADESDAQPTITFTFVTPRILEKLRIEKWLGGYPTQILISWANQTDIPLQLYTQQSMNGDSTNSSGGIVTNSVAIAGSEVVVLERPVEARVVRVEVVGFQEKPCMKIDLFGCQKTNCIDINECDAHNGYCEHQCHNTQGSYRCACEEGYDLYTFAGQGNIQLKEGETGEHFLDNVRFNKSCVPRHCSPLTPPENGKLIFVTESFAFPAVVEFRCNFGHQMRGASHLKCLADGTWNGTTPFCIPASCEGVKNNSAIGLFVQPESPTIGYGSNVSIVCTQQNRPARFSPLSGFRQCIYDPRTDGIEYWLSGTEIDCPLVDCGSPPPLAGAYYDESEENNHKVGSAYQFHCRAPYVLVGKSSYDDRMVRCNVDGTWDLGDLRCEGPVCVDPGHPDDGQTHLNSVEEGAIARITCNRPGYKPFPSDTINCTLGTACALSEDVGISSGFIPDGAFADNSDTTIWGYEPHKARMSSTGWCGSKDAFIFLSVDLQRIYTLTTLRIAGVAGSGHLKGHVTKMQLFYKVQFSQNYDNYPLEFTAPSGNHNKMHHFVLNPPLRARYILLGITEYESNPCLKFDLRGCLSPLSTAHEIPSHLQVGWNASVSQCLDSESPVFRNCPANPIYVQTDDKGQLLPVTYPIPEATDNSGYVSYTRVRPDNFEPPYPISQDLDVVYTAFDDAGNFADCVVRLRIPDTQPPVIKCPDSYSLWAAENETEKRVTFNESSAKLVIQDMSNITEVLFEPAETVLKVSTHVTVEVTVSDAQSNRNKCKFQVAYMPEPCSPWSLQVDEKSVQKKCSKHPAGTVCTVECRDGYRSVTKSTSSATTSLVLEQGAPQKYTCSLDGRWSPNNMPPSCVPIAQEPARYELRAAISYTMDGTFPPECLKGYEYLASAFFDTIDTVLTQRCSSSVQVFVRLLNVQFAPTSNRQMVVANYTVQILPTVLQKVFYELCGLTLRTMFDLKVPGASAPLRNLLTLSGDSVATQGVGCPSMNASSTQIWQGFGCNMGEILREPSASEVEVLPECLPCSKGTVFVNNTCAECPRGSYQDEEGTSTCKPCPENTYTQSVGAQSVNACLPVCGNGMYSTTGAIPCQLCPRHTFSGPPIEGGFKECEPCPEGTYTARLGSTGPGQCKQPCKAGHFSVAGLEPCSPCPINFYQPNIGQQRCLQCPNNTVTKEVGRFSEGHCKLMDCSGVKCQNRGNCAVVNHKEVCECRPGYTGKFCEEQVPICDTQPCLNGGSCEVVSGNFRCTCPQNYTGSRCQFGIDDCIHDGVSCPNGGVCQDLPGVETTKCICRTGFTGKDCSEISDPCQSQNPCRNGAECLPLQLGRYKCKCLPGWEGQNCEHNIG